MYMHTYFIRFRKQNFEKDCNDFIRSALPVFAKMYLFFFSIAFSLNLIWRICF